MIDSLPKKAISIRQPWAWLIVNGFKDIENRSWKTKYRGPILVHAGQKVELDAYDWVAASFGDSIRFPSPKEIVKGGIVGVTTIVDCLEYSDSPWYVEDNFGFVLQESRPLPFMGCPGKLSFFRVDYVCAKKL